MLEAIGFITTILAVIGCRLNNNRHIVCFYVWMISNTLSLGLHLYAGMWGLTCRDAIFFILCIDGIIKWRKKAQ